jgi:eukaryotic-like serine/threonine-protein kinase
VSTAGASPYHGAGPPQHGGLVPGEVLDGKYRIVRLIAQGGTGQVYEGLNQRIARRVAIKVLHREMAENDTVVRRFEREAQAAARIGSVNIVDVLDLGVLPGGERYLVMEYLEGRSLRDMLRRQVSPVEILPLVIQLLSALSEAHRAGIIHRDVKPENVFLVARKPGEPPLVKVLDFGVSKGTDRGVDPELTNVGAILGTPYYMAPEQAHGEVVDWRADLYSVGVILFQALAGQLPYRVDSFTQLVVKLSLEAPPQLLQVAPNVDPELAAIVDRAMARQREYRFQSADEMSTALNAWLTRSRTVPLAAFAAQQGPASSRPGEIGTGLVGSRDTVRGLGPPSAAPTGGSASVSGLREIGSWSSPGQSSAPPWATASAPPSFTSGGWPTAPGSPTRHRLVVALWIVVLLDLTGMLCATLLWLAGPRDGAAGAAPTEQGASTAVTSASSSPSSTSSAEPSTEPTSTATASASSVATTEPTAPEPTASATAASVAAGSHPSSGGHGHASSSGSSGSSGKGKGSKSTATGPGGRKIQTEL